MMQGHLKQKLIFENILKSNKLSHAYIFSGPEGVGKKLFAVNLAKSLMCQQSSFFEKCNCSSCTEIDMGTHPDFYILSGEELNVENIRQITETAAMTPLSGKWKVFILDNAEVFSNLQTVAGNALLKSLEEPGDATIFILITSRYDMIMPTIRSRAGSIKFSRLSFDEIKAVLTELYPEEKFIDRIALSSSGSLSKAIKIFGSGVLKALDFLETDDYKRFTEALLNFKDKDDLKIVTEFAYKKALENFKKSHGEYKFFLQGDYLLEILKRLPYNINIDLLKADFISKTIEV